MITEHIQPKAIVTIMPYRAEVALFASGEKMKWYFRDKLEIEVVGAEASYGCAFYDKDENGVVWFGLSIEDDANLTTLVHECSHGVDFVFDAFGVPCGTENTEVRAYTMAELIGDVADVFGFSLARNNTAKASG